jgi:c-di-GMP phosphodiesterase
MKTLNHIYKTKRKLQEFVELHQIGECKAVLLQIFSGKVDERFIRKIINESKHLIPHIQIIGTTTDGAISGNRVLERETLFAFMLFEKTQIKIHAAKNTRDDSLELSRNLTSMFGKRKKARVAIAFADGLHTNGDNFLKGFGEYDESLIVAGGMAGDHSEFEITYVFTHEVILSSGAVVALLYNPKLIVGTHAQYGWLAIGKKMVITKSKENRVYEIDGMRAVDIFARYLGEEAVRHLPSSGVVFPLIKTKEKLTRVVIGVRDDGSLLFGGNLEEGCEVTFGYGNAEVILEEYEKLKSKTNIHCSESIFVYSCTARKKLMGSNIALELSPLEAIASVSGFFTYGEFFSQKEEKDYQFLNQTMTILSLSEEPIEMKKYSVDPLPREQSRQNSILKSLAHLITQTTLELDEKNSELQKEVAKSQAKDNKLQQQSRLAQMGEMLAMIAHQWRQPLAAISSAAITMRMKAELGKLDIPTVQKKSSDILDYSQHLSTTINDFRNFFKPTKEKMETNFDTLVESTLSMIGTSLSNHNITITKEFQCSRSFISYPNEIMQVLLNLIKNAEDALIEQEGENPTITIRSYCDEGSYTLEIEDNAGGIEEHIIDSIFDPYFSTKTNKNGTGLGLYMSKTIIEDHCKGKITPINTGQGVIFRVKLVSLDWG